MNIERTSSSNLRQKTFTRRKNKILDSFQNLQVYRTKTTISVIFFSTSSIKKPQAMDEVARKQRLVLITWSGKSHSAQSET